MARDFNHIASAPVWPETGPSDAVERRRADYDPVTLKFRGEGVEDAYLADRRPALTRLARGVMYVGAVAAFFGSAIDWTELDMHEAEEMTIERVAVAFGLLFMAAVIGRHWIQRHFFAALSVGAAFIHLIWLANVPHLEEHISDYTGVLPVNMMLTFLLSGLIFRRAVWVAGMAFIAYGVALMANHPDPLPAMVYLAMSALFACYGGYAWECAKRDAWAEARLVAEERARSDRLLLNVLPPSIAERMKGGEAVIADRFEEAAVLFADVVGFTRMSATMAPERLVEILDDLFSRFDAVAEELDLEKIKTIGDCYMLASGLPQERRHDPERIIEAALRIRDEVALIADVHGLEIDVRIGIHTGPLVAGVIGRSKFVYDIWGDSVNVASRMESTAPVGAIQATQAVRDRLGDAFVMIPRGEIEVKGKGRMRAWLIESRAA